MAGSATPRVLIVEDDQAVRGFLSRALERGGCEPVGVRLGEEALSAVRTPPGAAIVLIDGLLPDMHGVRLAEQLLNDPCCEDVALCFVSGAIRESRPQVAGIGALSKPVRLREFLAAIDDLLAWRRGIREPIPRRIAELRRLEQGVLVGP
jgi:CheY-like chemotaxis protein